MEGVAGGGGGRALPEGHVVVAGRRSTSFLLSPAAHVVPACRGAARASW